MHFKGGGCGRWKAKEAGFYICEDDTLIAR